MGVNKVVFGAVSIMDISDSTVTADKLAKGATAYDKSGEKITGTMEAPTGTLEITENGTYDVTQYASASVNVAGSGGGGGSAEMCTVEIMADVPVRETSITWLDTNGNVHQANYSAMDLMMGITLEVAWNSFIFSTSSFLTDIGGMSSPGLTTAGGQSQLIHVMASGTFIIN